MPLLLLLAAWISGAAALTAETLWFRALGRGMGTSAEALAVVSASFLGGLGVGAAIASRRAPRSRSPLGAAAICEAVAGVLVAMSPFALAIVPDAHLGVLHLLSLEPGPSAWPAALVAVPILAIPTAFLGATLPYLVRGTVESVKRAGGWTGVLYGVNTLGAASGTAFAVWILLDEFGERASLRIAGAGNLVAALLLLMADALYAARRAKREDEEDAASPSQDDTPVVEPVAEPTPANVATAPRVSPVSPHSDSPPLAPPDAAGGASRGARRAAGIALFLSGFLALAGEVAWFRLLEPITGMHVYGFALLLVGVLIGTAAGAAVGGIPADRVRRPDLVLAVVVSVAGLLTLVSIGVAGYTPTLALCSASDAVEAAKAAHSTTKQVSAAAADALVRGRILGALLTVIPPLFAFAAAYPLAVRVRARSASDAAGEAGSVYAWNTAGNVVGSLVAGFVLLPLVGSATTLLLLGGLGLAVGAALWLLAPRPRSVAIGAVLVLPLGVLALPGLLGLPDAVAQAKAAAPSLPEVVCLAKWLNSNERYRVRSREDVRVLARMIAGPYPTKPGDPDGKPIEPRDGVVSWVGFLVERGSLRLRQGGLSESKIVPTDPDAGTETEVALGALPCLAHPSPKRACVIGHGAGWTAETVLASSIPWVDVAELEPAVLDLVEAYRGRLMVRDAKNAHLHIADGRLLLREAASKPQGERYDVIVSQPSHPWVPGAGHLFTREAYQLARSALNDGGVFAQWLNIFDMSDALFRTALESWREAFPQCWVFAFNNEVVLVGFRGDAGAGSDASGWRPKIDVARWRRAFRSEPIGERLRAADFTGPEDLIRRWALDSTTLVRFLDEAKGRASEPRFPEPSTDDDPRLERGLARAAFLGEVHSQSVADAMALQFPPNFAAAIDDPAEREALLGATALRAVELGVNSAESIRWTASTMPYEGGVAGRRARARRWFARANSESEKVTDENRRAWRAEGVHLLLEAVERAPSDPDVAHEYVEALVDTGDAEHALEKSREFAEKFPDHGPLLAQWARALMTVGDETTAEGVFRKALSARKPPPPAGTGEQLARLLLTGPTSSTKAAREVLEADPAVATHRASLEALRRLEIETMEPSAAARTKAARWLADLDRAKALESLATARSGTIDDADKGLTAARAATSALPDSSEAWRLEAWYLLRDKDADAAVAALRKAIEHAKDRADEERFARTMLRLFGADPARLDATVPPTGAPPAAPTK